MSVIIDGTNGISDVDGSASTPAIRGTDANTGIFFPAADTIAFAEGGAEAMRIDSSGRVGINTTSPSALLNVSVTGAANGSTTDALILNNTNSNSGDNLGTGISWMRTGNNASYIYTRIASIRTGTHDTDLAFSVNNGGTLSERARFNSTGALVFAGGTTTANGIGITFPATQSASTNANTLDDYEEGTFTLSNGGTTTYTTRSGRYTKIGNFVKCSFFHHINTIGTGSATTLSGLPFVPSSTAPTINGGVVTYISGLAVAALAIGVYADTGSQIIFMTRNASDTNATTQLPAVMGNSFAVYAEVSYLID